MTEGSPRSVSSYSTPTVTGAGGLEERAESYSQMKVITPLYSAVSGHGNLNSPSRGVSHLDSPSRGHLDSPSRGLGQGVITPMAAASRNSPPPEYRSREKENVGGSGNLRSQAYVQQHGSGLSGLKQWGSKLSEHSDYHLYPLKTSSSLSSNAESRVTTSSEIDFRNNLATLDADIARLQMQFKVALQSSK